MPSLRDQPGLASSLSPKPVMMTVTVISSSMDSSITAPKMTSASSSATSSMSATASFTSWMPSPLPPVTFTSTPRAPLIEKSSSSGLAIARRAASSALVGPVAEAVPITAMPMSAIMVRTSAKSRLTKPCVVIVFEMPCTACSRTSSALRNASGSVRFRSDRASSRWLGMQIRVSTCSFSSRTPSSALRPRRRPSNRNGLVTTPTVSAPISRASCAMTGAPPVPVPPPMPAVTKTMSALDR